MYYPRYTLGVKLLCQVKFLPKSLRNFPVDVRKVEPKKGYEACLYQIDVWVCNSDSMETSRVGRMRTYNHGKRTQHGKNPQQ